jgi:hypothetical protein
VKRGARRDARFTPACFYTSVTDAVELWSSLAMVIAGPLFARVPGRGGQRSWRHRRYPPDRPPSGAGRRLHSRILHINSVGHAGRRAAVVMLRLFAVSGALVPTGGEPGVAIRTAIASLKVTVSLSPGLTRPRLVTFGPATIETVFDGARPVVSSSVQQKISPTGRRPVIPAG